MPRTLPQRPNIAQLKTLACELQRAYNAGELPAQRRFVQQLPAAVSRQPLVAGLRQATLAQAQAVLAREYGFSSWPLFRQHVEQVRAGLLAQREQAALLPRARRQRVIAELPERVAAAAERGDLEALFVALQIGRRDGDDVRARLVAEGRFPAVVDALLTGVTSPSARVRFLVAQAMDHWADERCAAPLWTLLHDPVPRVRWAALHSLQCAACKLVPLTSGTVVVGRLVAMALSDPSIKVRRVATWELGQLCPDPQAVAALEQLCAEGADAVVLRNARLALSRLRRARQ